MLTVYSAQGSPGASTTAMYLAAHWASTGREVLLIEADPAGGSLSHHLGIQFTPGSASFVASGLPILSSNLVDHSQDVLFENLHVMPATSSPTGARGIVEWFAARAGDLRTISENEIAVIIDAGRITSDAAIAELTANAAGVVVVARGDSSPSSLEHLGELMAAGAVEGGPERGVVTIGDSPWSAGEWDENCGLTFCGAIKVSAEMTGDLTAFLSRNKRKSKKWRVSLEEVAERVFPYAQPPPGSPRPDASAKEPPVVAEPVEVVASAPSSAELVLPPPSQEAAEPEPEPEPEAEPVYEPVYEQPEPQPVYQQQPPPEPQPMYYQPPAPEPMYQEPPDYYDAPPPEPVSGEYYETPLPVYQPPPVYLPAPELPAAYQQPQQPPPRPQQPPAPEQQAYYQQQPAPEQQAYYQQQPEAPQPPPAPQATTPQYAAPAPPAPQATTPQYAAPAPPAPQATTPQYAAPAPPAPQVAPQQYAAPAPPPPQAVAPQYAAPLPSSPQAATPQQYAAPQPAAAAQQYAAPPEAAPQPAAPQAAATPPPPTPQPAPPQPEIAPSGSFRDWAARMHGHAPLGNKTTNHGGAS